MPNLSFNRVNQKLTQAKALFDGGNEAALTPVYLNSLKEAAAFHLICAYHHYLREIAETYWLKNTVNIRTEADLIAAFQLAKKHPTEAEELIALRKEENSWLSQLHIYYESLWLTPVAAVNEPEVEGFLIKAVILDADFDVARVNLSLIATWYEGFAALVMRQRETSVEF